MSPLQFLWQHHRPTLLLLACLLLLGLGFLLGTGSGPARPQLTKKQTRHLVTSRDSANHAAALDTARARHATTAAQANYTTGRRALAHAALLRSQSHVTPHPLPPSADTSAALADSLARVLAAY